MAWTNILGQTRVGIRGAQAQVQTTSLLLDSYSGAAAAYSLRKLTSTYTGNAIRVRRSSDNTEQNIGFDAGGNLNTIALLAFVGSGNGFVTTWYDQSGNSKNVINALNFCNKNGGISASITGYDGGKIKKISKYNVNVPSYDMQICEDMHLMIGHMVMKNLCGSNIE